VSGNTLQQRTLTALLIVPLPVAAVLLLPTPYLAVCLGLVLAPAAWEWAALAGFSSRTGRLGYLALVALCLLLLWQPVMRQWFPYITAAAVLFWCAIALFLFGLHTVRRNSGSDPAMAAMGLAVLIGPWVAITHLHAHSAKGPYLVLFLLVIVWAADILAYFAGRRWGRTKLAPAISPGKTRAGVYGALAGATLCGAVLAWSMPLSPGHVLGSVALCILVAIASVIGDLFESFVKRRRDLKDSGQLLPGHGGILDRIDSLTAAAPLFTLGVLWLEGFRG
jgi:phosphatidate cytidylyltransferase